MTRRSRTVRSAGAVATAAITVAAAAACGNDPTGPAPAVPGDRGAAAKALHDVEAHSEVSVDRYLYPTTTGTRDDRQNWADLYLPPGDHAADSIPLVVLIHGGGWQAPIGADVFVGFSRRLAERGLAVYNVEYRRVGLGGGWPTTFQDVAAALDHVPNVQAAHPSISTENAIVVGHSAGGQLAMWSGTRHNLDDDEIGAAPRFRPTYAISLAGALDLRQTVREGNPRALRAMGGRPNQVPDRYASVSPIENIDPDMPVVAMAGTADEVINPNQAGRYIAAVRKAGGRGTLVEFPGVKHTEIVDMSAPVFPEVVEIVSRAARHAQH